MPTLAELFDAWRYDSHIDVFIGDRRATPRQEGLAFAEDCRDEQIEREAQPEPQQEPP